MTAMNFAFTEEQEELRKTVRAFLDAKSSEEAVREQMETEDGYDAAVWSQMAEQMGLQGLHIPEEFGGSGFGYVELGIVLEEMGRSLLCAPFFSSVVLAGNTLIESGDDAAKQKYLPGIASGETIATLAYTEPSGKWDESGITATATKDGDAYKINGTKSFVLDGHTANLIIVAAKTDAGTSLFAVEGDAVGPDPHRTVDDGPDPQAGQARVRRHPGDAHRRGRQGLGHAHHRARPRRRQPRRRAGRWRPEGARDGRRLRQGARAVRPPDRFVPGDQAQVRRHAARGRVGQVRRLLRHVVRQSEMNDELPSTASLAKAYCSEAYFHAAAENIQIHGGIGFTWEHPAHLYFKRAKSSELLFGDPTYHREQLAQRIGI